MTAQEHARDLMLRLAAINSEGPNDISDLLVASFNQAIQEERDRCATIADRFKSDTDTPFARGQHSAAFNIGLAIRVPEQSKWAEECEAAR